MALTHLDDAGQAHMVDVSGKATTARTATAEGYISMEPATLKLIEANALKKGDALAVARIAGILAAKRVDALIPLCHTLPVSSAEIHFDYDRDKSRIKITATISTDAKTGVEMEALTAVSIAALTIYDMAKSSDRAMEIGEVRLLRKTGGKTGDYNGATRRRVQTS